MMGQFNTEVSIDPVICGEYYDNVIAVLILPINLALILVIIYGSGNNKNTYLYMNDIGSTQSGLVF